MPAAAVKKSSVPLLVIVGCAGLLIMALMLVLMVYVIRQLNAGSDRAPTGLALPAEPEDKAGGLRPEGFFVAPTLPAGGQPITAQPGQENQRFVVIVLNVPSRYFIPAQADIDELRKSRPGLRPALDKHKDNLESMRYYLPKRFRIQVVDTGRQNLAEYLDMKGTATAAFAPYQLDLLHKTALPYPTATLAVAWHLDARDCQPPFRVQFESYEPVQVPNKRITAWKSFNPPAN